MNRIAIAAGSRPDIIKLHPVYDALKTQPDTEMLTIASGQHEALADQTFRVFDWKPDLSFTMSQETRSSLPAMLGYLIQHYANSFRDLHPNLVVVHGDVCTALAAAQAAFLQGIPVAHVEAGLRSARFEDPFPEEGIRRLIAQVAAIHFAPTEQAAENLKKENIEWHRIHVTGNTVVDSLHTILARPLPATPEILSSEWRAQRPLVMITCHRRESWGENLSQLARRVGTWAEQYPEVCFVWPLHTNPQVRRTVNAAFPTGTRENLKLVGALSYHTFAHLLSKADLVLTDSGGVLEEATVLGRRTLVLRKVTERPEALECDYVTLVGYDWKKLDQIIKDELTSTRGEISHPLQLFGDGLAGQRIAERISIFLA